jgi:uncharacterized phage-associated protein
MSVVDVAQYILDVTGPLDTMKLQKLTYYAQAWAMVWNNGQPLFDEDFEAWMDGPVCPELYRLHAGQYTIKTLRAIPSLTRKQKAMIDAALKYYARFSGNQLSELTHVEQPWRDARALTPKGARSKAVIAKEVMRTFYDALRRAGTPFAAVTA